MKNKFSKLMIAAVATSIVGFSLNSQANPVAGFSGTATLASTSNPGDNLLVNYGVDLTGTIYTYTYTIDNTSSDTVDSFNVSFDADVLGAVTGGNETVFNTDGVTWLFAPLAQGTDITLFFTSLIAPTWGDANAADANPPSPWASLPGGDPVPVPNVPDGGMTVAFLGLAFAGVEGLRRKFIKA